MALITNVNICRKRGDTAPFTITITDDATPGVPIDITGFSFLLTVDPAQTPDSAANNLFQLGVGTGLVLSDPANGVITVELPIGDADQTPAVYFYDLQQTDTGGFIRTILEGQWEVVQDITK